MPVHHAPSSPVLELPKAVDVWGHSILLPTWFQTKLLLHVQTWGKTGIIVKAQHPLDPLELCQSPPQAHQAVVGLTPGDLPQDLRQGHRSHQHRQARYHAMWDPAALIHHVTTPSASLVVVCVRKNKKFVITRQLLMQSVNTTSTTRGNPFPK